MALITSNLHEALIKHLDDYPHPTRVDVISSYIRKEGLEAVLTVFEKLAEDGGTKVRIFTTLQREITDIWSLDTLARLKNTSIYTFWPREPKFHAKGWLFLYGHDNNHPDDTVIVGSSNLTEKGVRVAVEWNVLLRRKLPGLDPDSNRIINDFNTTFSKYVENPLFAGCLFKHEVHESYYDEQRALLEQRLLTDDEVVEKGASLDDQNRWRELKAEQDKIARAARNSLEPPLSFPEFTIADIYECAAEIKASRTLHDRTMMKNRMLSDFPLSQLDHAIFGAMKQDYKAVLASLDA